MQSRRKWKNRYYKMRSKNKELQKSVEQIYDDYQDIGKMAFDYSDKIEQLESDNQKLIEKLEEDIKEHTYGDIEIDATGQYAKEILSIVKGENNLKDKR